MRRRAFGATGPAYVESNATKPTVDSTHYTIDPTRIDIDVEAPDPDEIPLGQMGSEGTEYDSALEQAAEDEKADAMGIDDPASDYVDPMNTDDDSTGLSTGAKLLIGGVALGGLFLIVRAVR